jgi:hypothetical protein
MAYSNSIKKAAMELRRKGYSLKELSEQFHIAKATASLWSTNIPLNKKAKKRILAVKRRGQLAGAQSRRARTKAIEKIYFDEAFLEIQSAPDYNKIICAMIYWCEGRKKADGMAFTNSDPKLVKTFLKLLRGSFVLDEKRFHPCIHLHSYHLPKTQLDFWSKVTDINKQQFIKPYRKANSGKRIREGYQGCIDVRYSSSDLARRLLATAKAFLQHTGA